MLIVVLEITDFAVLPGTGDEFTSAVREGNGRELIGPFLAGAPRMDHVTEVPLSV